jgi:hypothetical protein
MMKRKNWISFLLLLSLFVVPADLFAAGSERMKNVVTEIKNQEIVVTAELVDGFSRETLNDIHDGIPKDFYYYLLLKRKQKNWFDEEILAKTIRYTVKYDTLKKKYSIVQRDGERVVESTVDDVETMKRLVSKIDHVKLAPTRFLKSRNRYYVSVKSQMKAAKLPFYVDYFLFFIPFLELDTPWADSDTLSVSRGG